MRYLSAQPDEYYFTWQIEIQLYNFKKLGIKRENIHVLIGYDLRRGLQYYYQELIEKNQDYAMFYVYPDQREKKNYASTGLNITASCRFDLYFYSKQTNIQYFCFLHYQIS